ncbi:MAG: hypothetical protein A3A28_05755 [Candidatus Sungbacteria bacterium RIFCSPLOWO2_01_FULL_47_32]|nr:MAG: hypothetical protein UX72_C0010G0012 [Parcubacteria group bacterium GW2011_GWA2_47_10]OHA04892.1 MAG: hypothetical protein A3A28_05755 [Candidatus Sungbacteria bacterium RIFCSPLOWO2_01_FULL_47_32]
MKDKEKVPGKEDNSGSEESSITQGYALPVSIIIASLIIGGSWISTAKQRDQASSQEPKSLTEAEHPSISGWPEAIAPSQGIELPVRWGDLGVKMVSVGIIDDEKFINLYAAKPDIEKEAKKLLYEGNNANLVITEKNSGLLLNLLWALGLGTSNPVLAKGPMADSRYGGAGNFASTGGWTIAKGGAMEHFNRHPLIVLTEAQQKLVEDIAKNIYRPCCGNSTYFPDCNHGMAMLGLLELMASQNASESDMYRVALSVNSYWFPDTYSTVEKYFESKKVSWSAVNPKEVLGAAYSSAQGYQRIASQVAGPQGGRGGSGCGVDAGAPSPQPKRQSGCGVQ